MIIDTSFSHGRGALKGVANDGLRAAWQFRRSRVWIFDQEVERWRWQVDGLIASVHDARMRDVASRFNVPTVNASSGLMIDAFPMACSDSAAIGRMAAGHLLQLGFRTLAFVSSAGLNGSAPRHAAFRAAADRGGAACLADEGDLLNADTGPERAIARLSAWLAALPRPAGLFAANDTIRERVLATAQNAGRHVPEDLAIIGADDEIVAASPSSIDINAEAIGREAARILDGRMRGEPPPASAVAPIGAVARASSDTVAIADVGAAIRFIRNRANAPIHVGDVLDAVPLSRRPLERRFRLATGRSILDEIHRVHLDRARQPLAHADLALPQVARAPAAARPRPASASCSANASARRRRRTANRSASARDRASRPPALAPAGRRAADASPIRPKRRPRRRFRAWHATRAKT